MLWLALSRSRSRSKQRLMGSVFSWSRAGDPPSRPSSMATPMTTTTPTAIPFKWPPSLPKQAQWRQLGFKALVRRAVLRLNALETRHDEFFVSERPATATDLQLTRLKQLSQEYVKAFENLSSLLENIAMVGIPGVPVSDSKLADFFPQGVLPREPAPPELIAALYLSLFRGTFRVFRRCVVEFVSIQRREGWGAVDVLGIVVGQPLPSKLLKQTIEFNDIYEEPCRAALRTLSYMLESSKPVRRRVGEDAVFLDSISLWLFASTSFLQFACTHPPFRFTGTQESFYANFFALKLSSITMESNRYWNTHSDSLRIRGWFPPKDLLKLNLESLLLFIAQDPQLRQKQTSLLELGGQIEVLFRSLAFRSPANPIPVSTNIFRTHESNALQGNIPDSCDYCGQSALPNRPKFRRCGKCKIARYCSPSCQQEAWKHGGHRRMCFDAVKLVWA